MRPSLRERVLDAAVDEVAASGWSSVTIVAVGERAGVSRQSVYNEFGSRSGLATALIQRETLIFLEAVGQELADASDSVAGVTAATRAVLELGERNVLLAAAVSGAPGSGTELLPLLTSQSQPIIDSATALVAGWLRSQGSRPPLDEAKSVATAEVIVRLVLSFLICPQGTPAKMAATVGDVAASLIDV